MSRVRRARYLAFTCTDELTVDVGGLLGGTIDLLPVPQPAAVSVASGKLEPLSREELDLAFDVPATWTAREEVLEGRPASAREWLEDLVRKGVVIADDDEDEIAELRRREETLGADHWSPHAALYHFMAKWRDVHVDPDLELGELGKPPPHFFSVPGADVAALPRAGRRGQLYDALLARRTSRAFDRGGSMTADQLSAILYYVWGGHGLAEFAPGIAMVKKTSPSGGGLHPIEVYPLVRDVDGIDAGLYHYDVEGHALELISSLTAEAVEELALEFTAGQTYFQGAHALFVMAGRFDRTFWKYRDHVRAYAVLLLDAGHLSQSFYLVGTDLGLGTFVTGAVNGANIEERLGLDGYKQGALLVCGCGPAGAARPGLEPVFEPYPR